MSFFTSAIDCESLSYKLCAVLRPCRRHGVLRQGCPQGAGAQERDAGADHALYAQRSGRGPWLHLHGRGGAGGGRYGF